ncbi:hypothetical protein B0H13DRAFT_1896024 [Mycena leptocephala]|nr:hypothetical protein B0H13DRAFT_1896024 [Mycena leptocephala]
MFEIMYRICLSIGFPCSDDSLCPLDHHVLLPLIMGTRETCALLKTADDYSAYNRFGEVVDTDRFIGGLARIIKQGRGRASASDSESLPGGTMSVIRDRNRGFISDLRLFGFRGGRLSENPGENALCTCVSVFLVITPCAPWSWVTAGAQLLIFSLIIFPVDTSRSSSLLLPPWITRRVGKRANTCVVGSVSGSDIFVHQFQTGTPSVHESSGLSASYVESASGSSSDDDLVDPADLLSSFPAKSPKDTKPKKRSVDAMDVDEEVAAPPPKRAHRSGNKGSAVLNTAESSSKPVECPAPRPVPRPKASAVPSISEPLAGPRRPSGASSSAAAPRSKTCVVDLETIEIKENLQLDDSFDFEVHRTNVDGISRMYEFYTQDAEEIGKEYKRVEAKDPQGFLRTVEYFSRQGFALSRTGEWLHSLGETIGDLVSFYNRVLLVYVAFQYRYGIVEPLAPLPSDPEDPIFLDARDPQPRWRQYTRDAFPPFDAEPHVSMDAYENAWNSYKLALARHEASESEKETAFLEKQRAKFSEWRERARVPLRVKTVSLIADFLLPRLLSRPAVPLSVSPPPLPIPRTRGKAMSMEPEIAFLDGGSVSGSDDQLLSVLRKSKGKKKAVVASRGSREKSRAGSEGEAEVEPEIITCTVKVKKGKRQSAVELTGPRNEYNSQLWHDRNDLFVIDAPTTSTGGNKIVTHAYPFDENHPRFSSTWKRRITLSSLPARTGCIRCLLADNKCVRLRYGDETPTAVCTHCRADNATCELSPVEFDWDLTDTTLPDVNTEWMELQLTLMLEIADEVGGVGTTERLLVRFLRHLCSSGTDRDVLEARRAIFGSENSSVAGEDSDSNDSGTEVEGGKKDDERDVAMDQEKGSGNDEPPLTASADASGRSSPPSVPSVRLTMDSVEIPSDLRHMFSPSPPRRSSGSRASPPKLPQAALLSPPVAVSPALSLSTSVFGKPGSLLGAKPNETSKGVAGNGEMLEEGELDAKGEIVVGTSTGETPGAGVDVNMD